MSWVRRRSLQVKNGALYRMGLMASSARPVPAVLAGGPEREANTLGKPPFTPGLSSELFSIEKMFSAVTCAPPGKAACGVAASAYPPMGLVNVVVPWMSLLPSVTTAAQLPWCWRRRCLRAMAAPLVARVTRRLPERVAGSLASASSRSASILVYTVGHGAAAYVAGLGYAFFRVDGRRCGTGRPGLAAAVLREGPREINHQLVVGQGAQKQQLAFVHGQVSGR